MDFRWSHEIRDKLIKHLRHHNQDELQTYLGSWAEAASDVREGVEVTGKRGDYILAAVHTVETDVPSENIFAVYETVRKFGEYEQTSGMV